MKSILLNNYLDEAKNVYAQRFIDWLKNEAGLMDEGVTKEELFNSPEKFIDVEYVFSTWGMPVLTEEEIKKYLPSLKCVFFGAGSVQHFALPFLNCGIKVFSAWGANAVPVAEYTVAQIILANKGFFASSRMMKSQGYSDAAKRVREFSGNYGETVGIIGAGAIGKLVIKKLKDYKLNVLVFDPFLPDETAEELGVKKVSLKEIFSNCAVISNHLANNEQTQHILNYDLFSLVGRNVTFLNTGRGAQVLEEDLIKVLKEKPDFTAILDVTFPEPPVDGSELYTLENCIITPHIAGSSGNEPQRLAEYMLNAFKLYMNNIPCDYEVTKEMLQTMA